MVPTWSPKLPSKQKQKVVGKENISSTYNEKNENIKILVFK